MPLHRAGYVVTINPDNRTVSRTTMTGEYLHVVDRVGMPPAFLEGRRMEALLRRVDNSLGELNQSVRILAPYL